MIWKHSSLPCQPFPTNQRQFDKTNNHLAVFTARTTTNNIYRASDPSYRCYFIATALLLLGRRYRTRIIPATNLRRIGRRCRLVSKQEEAKLSRCANIGTRATLDEAAILSGGGCRRKDESVRTAGRKRRTRVFISEAQFVSSTFVLVLASRETFFSCRLAGWLASWLAGWLAALNAHWAPRQKSAGSSWTGGLCYLRAPIRGIK